MILIVDRAYQVKSWLASAPLSELDTFDIAGQAVPLQTIEHASLVIIADYQKEEFRVMKDRHPENQGSTWIDHIDQLPVFLNYWMTQEMFYQATAKLDDNEGQADNE